MTGPYLITAEAIYDDRTLVETLGVTPAALHRARRTGELRYTRRAGRTLYLGSWIREWLTLEPEPADTTTAQSAQ